MKKEFSVTLSEASTKPDNHGDLYTHLVVNLQNAVDLKFFQVCHRINKKPKAGEMVAFSLKAFNPMSGEVTTISELSSKGSKTRDFVLAAHLIKFHDPSEEYNHLFVEPWELTLVVDVETPLFAPDRGLLADRLTMRILKMASNSSDPQPSF